MTEAPVFSVVADVAIVKGETPAADRTWLSFPDGTARRAVVHVIHDLPHLVVESVFGLEDGLWGTLAAGGVRPAASSHTASSQTVGSHTVGSHTNGSHVNGSHTNGSHTAAFRTTASRATASHTTSFRATGAAGRGNGRIRLVTDAPADDLATPAWPGHLVAKAAVNAVVNRWSDGPGTPAGVRARLRRNGPDAAELAGRLDDETIRVATVGVRRLYREWSALPLGGTLRLTWPLHVSWLRLM